MKQEELRICNYVFHKGNVIMVENIMSHAINVELLYGEIFEDIPVDKLDPIPLTEEWLLKCGFNQNILCWVCDKFTIAGSVEHGYVLTGYCLENIFPVNVFYVHQLQNLYFALTGKELEIKL